MTPDILREIVAQKRIEVGELKTAFSTGEIEKMAGEADPVRGFKAQLENKIASGKLAVIAEIKKASPSKGVIREAFDPGEIARSYGKTEAGCLSVLTDQRFFQGSNRFLELAHREVELPILRKDFIIDPIQVLESRAIHADCILLIVSILDDDELRYLSGLARDLSMNVLVEVHSDSELRRALAIDPDILGINNRNLRTFEVSLDTTIDLVQQVDPDTLVVTESGIHTREDVEQMLAGGVGAFLVGEAFMREADPGSKLRELFF